MNLRCVTAEQAANEISKPADKVVIVLQYNLTSKCCANLISFSLSF